MYSCMYVHNAYVYFHIFLCSRFLMRRRIMSVQVGVCFRESEGERQSRKETTVPIGAFECLNFGAAGECMRRRYPVWHSYAVIFFHSFISHFSRRVQLLQSFKGHLRQRLSKLNPPPLTSPYDRLAFSGLRGRDLRSDENCTEEGVYERILLICVGEFIAYKRRLNCGG